MNGVEKYESPFGAYDIRGIYEKDISVDFAKRLGFCTAKYFSAKYVVIGRDGRKGGKELVESLCEGISLAGATPVLIGEVSSPMFYFSLINNSLYDAGIMVTASHNPKEYNGFKICSQGAKPVFIDNGLKEIFSLMKSQEELLKKNKELHADEIVKKEEVKVEVEGGKSDFYESEDVREEYELFMKQFVKPLKRKYRVVVDCSGGMGVYEAKVLEKLYAKYVDFVYLHNEVSQTFSNRSPNPTSVKNLDVLIKTVKDNEDIDFGVCFDGDADRVVFVDEKGKYINPDIIGGIISLFLCKKNDLVGVDFRTSPSIIELLEKKNIFVKRVLSGNPYLKKLLLEEEGRFGAERSAHYIFRETKYSDSSLLAIIYCLEMIDSQRRSLKYLADYVQGEWLSGEEVNFSVVKVDECLQKIKTYGEKVGFFINLKDGITMHNEYVYVNVRKSNTEPLLRVCIHGKSDFIIEEILEDIKKIVNSFANRA